MLRGKSFKKMQFAFFAALAVLTVCVAVFAPYIAPADPYKATMKDSLKAPGTLHRGAAVRSFSGEGGGFVYKWGTDKLGRDIMSRVIWGTRTSLTMTLSLVAVIFVLGTSLGVTAGYFGGITDAVIMRIADMMISFPGLVLAIAIAGLLGPNMVNAVIAISAVSWTKYARLARSMVMGIKNNLYIDAAILSGSGSLSVLRRHVLPNMVMIMLVTAGTDIGTMMLELASLSFLGFGAQPPEPEWGLMLNEGRAYIARAPWLMIYPGLAIVSVVVIFNMLGDSLRDLLEPQQA